MDFALTDLVAATFTPFDADGALRLEVVEQQAEHLVANQVGTAFIGGTTGEYSSLTFKERQALADRWAGVARGTKLQLVVHVGSNCLEDSKMLASQAQRLGAVAISALAPCYFKPRDSEALLESMAAVAAAAPETPFYYYEIPSMTGITISPAKFLARAAERIPNFAGLKFSSNDLSEYQLCLAMRYGSYDLPFGSDEILLAALVLGARGAVGSSFNYAAPLYHRMLAAFKERDLIAAQREQLRGARLIRLFTDFGLMAAGKATMEMLGVPVGPPRLPHLALADNDRERLRYDLEQLGFFEWIGG
jgi:N-acetylneuraminate lyase